LPQYSQGKTEILGQIAPKQPCLFYKYLSLILPDE